EFFTALAAAESSTPVWGVDSGGPYFQNRSFVSVTGFLDSSSRCVTSTHTLHIQPGFFWREVAPMAKLKLTLACWDYDRTRPLIDGRVHAEGIDLEIKVMRPRETFPRMLEDKEFQVSELSLGSYVSLKGRGACPFVAVPVALSKIFRHSCIYIRS